MIFKVYCTVCYGEINPPHIINVKGNEITQSNK